MTESEIEAKFRPLAGSVLQPAQTDRLLAALWRLEEQASIHDLMQLTTGN